MFVNDTGAERRSQGFSFDCVLGSLPAKPGIALLGGDLLVGPRPASAPDGVPGLFPILPARRDHHAIAFFTEEVDASAGEHRRCGVIAADSLLPLDCADPGVEARGDAVVTHHVEFVAGHKG